MRAHALAEVLALAVLGPDGQVVVSPGSRSTPLALAFARIAGPRLHIVLDERAAGFIALGLARASRRPAVLVCTSGSAAAHYLPAVIEARHAGVPLVVLSADRPPELQRSGAHQTIDQSALFGEQVVFACQLPVLDDRVSERWLRNLAAQARDQAVGRGGPVHLNVPLREPLWQPGCDADARAAVPPARVLRGQVRLGEAELEALSEELVAAPRGALVCGPLAPATADAQRLAAAVARLARALGWPLLAEPASGLRFGSHDRRAVIASADALLRDAGFAAAHRPDRVVRIGRVPTSKALGRWLEEHATERVILLDAGGRWHDPMASASLLVVADPAASCEALAARIEARGPADEAWLAAWKRADERAWAAIDPCLRGGMWEGALARALIAALPDPSQLHLGSSMPIRDVDSFGGTSGRRIRVHANRGANGIDGLVATAAGEALGWQEGPTVLLLGDLSLLHDLDGLATAAELGADLVVVAVANGGGAIFEHLPIREHPTQYRRLFLTPQHTSLERVGRALCDGWRRVSTAAELDWALGAAIDAGGVQLIEVPVDRDHNVAQHRRAWAAVADSLAQREAS